MSKQNATVHYLSLHATTKPLTFREIPEACVLFIDMANFTKFAANKSDKAIIQALHYCYCLFDVIIKEHIAIPIKYNGDGCIILIEPNSLLTSTIAENGLYLFETLSQTFAELCNLYEVDSALRGGLALGPVLSGKIGSELSCLDIWGHTVNLAARLEQHATPNTLLMDSACHKLLLTPTLCKAIKLNLKGFSEQPLYQYHKRET